MIKEIKSILYDSETFRQLNDVKNGTVFCKVHGSLISFITDYLFENKNKKIVFISNDENKLSALRDDLELLTDCDNIIYPFEKVNEGDDYIRTLKSFSENEDYIILLSPADLDKEAIDKDKFRESLLDIHKNQGIPFEEFIEKLNKYNFSRNDFVEQVGDFSVRGGIIDIFPEHSSTPLRIEFFGDMIESIREFDITTQRSIREIEKTSIGFNLTSNSGNDKVPQGIFNSTLKTYIPSDALLLIDEPDTVENIDEYKNDKYFFSSFTQLGNTINFESKTQPDFQSNVKLLFPNLSEYIKKNYTAYILCSDEYQKKRINALIEDFRQEG